MTNTDTTSVDSKEVKACLVVPFANAKHAQIVLKTLEVDQEPRRELISKRLSLVAGDEEEDSKAAPTQLKAEWTARESRLLRVSVNALIDHIQLILETIDQFEESDSE